MVSIHANLYMQCFTCSRYIPICNHPCTADLDEGTLLGAIHSGMGKQMVKFIRNQGAVGR